jgi:hypothetical protein
VTNATAPLWFNFVSLYIPCRQSLTADGKERIREKGGKEMNQSKNGSLAVASVPGSQSSEGVLLLISRRPTPRHKAIYITHKSYIVIELR